MNRKNPAFIALQFNEYINDQDIQGLSGLMPQDHTFIDRKGEIVAGKDAMTEGWIDFFNSYLEYSNSFHRAECRDDTVILYGYVTWESGSDPDNALWTARIEDELVAEWRIYEDTEANRRRFNIQ